MIYLDYNATHPPYKKIIEKANTIYYTNYANSSGRSSFSQQSKQIIEESRNEIANIFSVLANQITFTSSATEANFLAIRLICGYLRKSTSNKSLSVGVSPLEHPSSIEALKKDKNLKLHILPLNSNGQLNLTFLEESLAKNEFELLVCTLVHSETGILQPCKRITDLTKKFSVPWVCDAVQAISRLQEGSGSSGLNLNMFSISQEAPVFFTMCGHKIGAGFGTGVIITPVEFLNKNISRFTPFYEGTQEFSLRPGSHNLASIVAFKEVLSQKVKKKQIMLS